MPTMTRSCRLAGAALAVLAWAGAPPGSAAEPAAIVEDVQGAVKDVQPFDYVAAGTQIQLPARAVLVLGYLKSCARATITGGKVTIGDDQRTVHGGPVKPGPV